MTCLPTPVLPPSLSAPAVQGQERAGSSSLWWESWWDSGTGCRNVLQSQVTGVWGRGGGSWAVQGGPPRPLEGPGEGALHPALPLAPRLCPLAATALATSSTSPSFSLAPRCHLHHSLPPLSLVGSSANPSPQAVLSPLFYPLLSSKLQHHTLPRAPASSCKHLTSRISLGQNLLPSCVTFSKLHNLSEPQLPHL